MTTSIYDGIGILGLAIIAIGLFAKSIYKDKKGYWWMTLGIFIFLYYLNIKF